MKNSNRKYKVLESQNGVISTYNLNLKMLESDNSETVYALQEQIDEVLDLKINEAMYFQPNRDDNSSKAIITRVS